jgi:hypothetical protein
MEINFKNELKNIILVAFRYFEFLHSQGQSRHFDRLPLTSGLPQGADIVRAGRHLSKVPLTEVPSPIHDHLISSFRTNKGSGRHERARCDHVWYA